MAPNMVLWFHNTDLNKKGAHALIPEKKFSQIRRINLGDAGEVQYDVVAVRFLGRQDPGLDACGGITSIFTREGEDFGVVLLVFANLKHRTYLRVMKGILLSHSESFFSGRNNPPIEVGESMQQQI
jgi:hypothetical protein